MLDSMRRNANSWIFPLIFAVITFVFVINFGPWAGNVGPKAPTYAAQVNGTSITVAEMESAYGGFLKRIQGISEEQAKMLGLRERALDGLVARELLAQLAEANNLSVSDQELVAYIKKSFLGGVSLSPAIYEQAIQSEFHMSAGEFDRQERRKMLADKMRKLLESGVYVSESDVNQAFLASKEKIAVDYIKISPNFFPDSELPKDEEMSKWVLAHEKDLKAEFAKQTGKKSYEEMKAEIAKSLFMKEQKMAKAKEYANAILAELESGKSLSNVSAKGLVRTPAGKKPDFNEMAPVFSSTEPFARAETFGQGLPQIVSAAAFKLPEVMSYTKEPIISNESLYVAQLKERKLPEEGELKTEMTTFRERLTAERRADFVESYIEHLKKNAKIIINSDLSLVSKDS